jgi:hypothetical protein
VCHQNGRATLGDVIYRYITSEHFSPDCLLDCLDLSSEYHAVEIANRVEASIYVWRRRGAAGKPGTKSSSWGGIVKDMIMDTDKHDLLAERAEGLLISLKQRFPGLTQTSLDMSKIQYNKVSFCVLRRSHSFSEHCLFASVRRAKTINLADY